MSLPLRERGLKYRKRQLCVVIKRRSLYGSVDWNSFDHFRICATYCRSLYGSVDWNSAEKYPRLDKIRRSLYGSVDWNIVYSSILFYCGKSLPLRERGLKYVISSTPTVSCSRSLYGSVDWNVVYIRICNWKTGRSLYGSVDWNQERISSWLHNKVAPFTGAWIEI